MNKKLLVVATFVTIFTAMFVVMIGALITPDPLSTTTVTISNGLLATTTIITAVVAGVLAFLLEASWPKKARETILMIVLLPINLGLAFSLNTSSFNPDILIWAILSTIPISVMISVVEKLQKKDYKATRMALAAVVIGLLAITVGNGFGKH